MNKVSEKTGIPIAALLKILLFSYIVTAVCLALSAFLLFRFHLSENGVEIAIILTNIFATFLAGFMAGKKMKQQKYLWGLVEGALYFFVLTLLSLLSGPEGQETGQSVITAIVLCIGGGTLGGMVS